jgi:hypothetical protein
MSLIVSLASQAVTTSNATLGTAVPTGQLWRVRAVNIQQPTGAAAKNIALAVGTTATAANVKRRYALPSGLQTAQDFPDLMLAAGEQLNVVTDAGTTEAVISVTVIKDLIA